MSLYQKQEVVTQHKRKWPLSAVQPTSLYVCICVCISEFFVCPQRERYEED